MRTRMRTATLVASALLLLASTPHPSIARDDDPSGLRLKLSLDETRLIIGQQYTFAYLIENTGPNATYVFNPFCQGLLESPITLLLYDATDREVANLSGLPFGSRRLAQKADWVYLPRDGCVGGRSSFRVDQTAGRGGRLMPGEYTMRMFIWGQYVTDEAPSLGDRNRDAPRESRYLSNAIKVTVVRPGSADF